MDKKSQQLQKHTRNIPASAPSQILVSRAAQALGVDTFTVLSLIQRDELVPTRASSGEITLPKSELIKLIGKRRWHMLKPNGQYRLSAITGLAQRLSQGERNAYLTASEVVEHEFEELVQLKRQLDGLPPTFLRQPTGSSNTNITFGLDHSVWEIQTRLLKLRASEIILCQQSIGNAFAVIQLFQADSPHAEANGNAQILLRDTDSRRLLREFAAEVRHTLRFMASNLIAKAQKVVWERFPEHNPGKVMRALSTRCQQLVGKGESMAANGQNPLEETSERA